MLLGPLLQNGLPFPFCMAFEKILNKERLSRATLLVTQANLLGTKANMLETEANLLATEANLLALKEPREFSSRI